MTVHQRNKHF